MRDPVQDARVAQDILDNLVFQAAVEALDARYVEDWRAGASVEARERAHVRQEALQDVLLALAHTVQEGVLQEHRNRQQNL